jgi:hypothetical protein
MLNSSDPDRSCAIRPDGTLKDASEIDWHYDPDKEVSARADVAVAPLPTDSPPSIDPFFAGQAPVTIKVAGAHRSIHVTHPSARAIDPNNTMTAAGALLGMQSSTAPAKHKAAGPAPACHVARKVISEPSADDEISDEIHIASTVEPAMCPVALGRYINLFHADGGLTSGEWSSLYFWPMQVIKCPI